MNKYGKYLFSLAAVFLLTVLAGLGALRRVDKWAQDWFFQKPGVSSGDIIIIGIDVLAHVNEVEFHGMFHCVDSELAVSQGFVSLFHQWAVGHGFVEIDVVVVLGAFIAHTFHLFFRSNEIEQRLWVLSEVQGFVVGVGSFGGAEREVEHALMKAGRMAVEVERERIAELKAEIATLKEHRAGNMETLRVLADANAEMAWRIQQLEKEVSR